MRALATRLGVVPGALYRHVRNKEQLHDLVLDGVLAEIDTAVDLALAWTDRVKVLAHRLRKVLEDHPGIAKLLKTRDPLGPHSLAWRGIPGPAARGRPARTADRAGLLPRLRLHARVRLEQSHVGQ